MLYSQHENKFTYFPQMLLLNHFEWQLHQRNSLDGGVVMSINMSLITGAAAFIEAVTKNFLLGHIREVKDKNVNSPNTQVLFDALLANTQEQLLQGTWSDLAKAYTSLIGFKPTQSSEENEAIQKLFTFRNELVHGKEIQAEVKDDAVSYLHKYQGIAEYLIKMKVVDQELLRVSNGNALLCDKVADYFLGKALAFVFNLLHNAGDAGIIWRTQLGTSIFSLFHVPYLHRLLTENGIKVVVEHADIAGNPLPEAKDPNLSTY